MAIDPALLTSASKVLGALSGGQTVASAASDPIFSAPSIFDTSGWNIAGKGAEIKSSASKELSQGGVESARSPAVGGDDYLPYVSLAVALMIAWRALKRS